MTTKRQLFVNYYIGEARGCATEAARLAGYADAKNEGYRLKKDPEIRREIDEWLTTHTLSSAEVLHRLTEHATASLEDFITVYPGGMWGFDLERARDAKKLHLLKELQYEKGKGAKIALHDAQNALVQLGRYWKLFTDRNVQEGDPDNPVCVKVVKEGISMDDL